MMPARPHIAVRSSITPSVAAIAVKECPEPIGVTVSPRSAASVTTAATSAGVVGRSTRSGVHDWLPAQFVQPAALPRVEFIAWLIPR